MTAENEITEKSLHEEFLYCESIINDAMADKLGESNSEERNEKLKQCVEKLQQITQSINRFQLFSANEQIEELPTRSIAYLLVPAYLAYAINEINVESQKR